MLRISNRREYFSLAYTTLSFALVAIISSVTIVLKRDQSDFINTLKDYDALDGNMIVILLCVHHIRIFLNISFAEANSSFLKAKKRIFGHEFLKKDIFFYLFHLIVLFFIPILFSDSSHVFLSLLLLVQLFMIAIATGIYRRPLFVGDIQRKANIFIVCMDIAYWTILIITCLYPSLYSNTLTYSQNFKYAVLGAAILLGIGFIVEIIISYWQGLKELCSSLRGGRQKFDALPD